jgi:hypothetical protein
MRTDLPAPLTVVLGVIMTGGNDIDRDYLWEWADRLNLGDELARALRQADAI